MNTEHLTLSDRDMARAAHLIQNGGLVAFPTETVYGLGANGLDCDAVARIFKAKGRPSDNPLILHIHNESQLNQLVTSVPPAAQKLMDAFWPGPLTIVMKKTNLVPAIVSAGLDTVAVRLPSHPVARRLLELCNVPVAAPSANASGRPSPTTATHVKEDMDGRIDAILDGGKCDVGVESTVVDVTERVPVLLRPGGVTEQQLLAVLGKLQAGHRLEVGQTPRSPGMKYIHYAPKANVIVVRGAFLEKVLQHASGNQKVGILCHEPLPFPADYVVRYLGQTPAEHANTLFAHLRAFDQDGVDVIYVQDVPPDGIGSAVRNRLYRAAGEQFI